MKRLICRILYYGFARHLPAWVAPGGKIFKGIRYRICRPLFASCGRNVLIGKGASFGSGASITIGDNSTLGVNARLEGEVRIGRDVMMGPDCEIYTRNHRFDRLDISMRRQGFSEAPVEIGDDVWIGSRVIILPGVQIGHGAVIGAGSVVPKSVPPCAIAAGNPAHVIRYRKSGSEPEAAE